MQYKEIAGLNSLAGEQQAPKYQRVLNDLRQAERLHSMNESHIPGWHGGF